MPMNSRSTIIFFTYFKTRLDARRSTNMKHPLDNANSSDSEAPPSLKKTKLEALKAILDEFGLIIDVSFKLFNCEPPQPVKAILPPNFPPITKLYDYFTLFFTLTLL